MHCQPISVVGVWNNQHNSYEIWLLDLNIDSKESVLCFSADLDPQGGRRLGNAYDGEVVLDRDMLP